MLSSSKELADTLARVAQGDRQAFATVYQATAPKLLGIAARILGTRDRAEDVLQDVYVKIWDNAHKFDPAKASPITWMAAITRNRALDEVRRVKPQSIEDRADALDVPSDDVPALDRIEKTQDLARLTRCLGGLDEERRQIVLLAYYNGMSREALSQRFGRPVATIKTWLHRSLAQLKSCLQS